MTGFPQQFIHQMHDLLGSEADAFFHALSQSPPVSVRLNPKKGFTFDHYADHPQRVAWSTCGYYLPERPVFTLDPLFHAGAYYVQEAASMFVEQAITQLLEDREDLNVLDLCAAPGGKLTHLLSLFPDSCLVVGNEAIRGRTGVLYENVCKWGYPNAIVTNNAAKDFERSPHFFDVMLVDAPCSGEGMFRKDASAVEEWSEGNVALCAERQRKILADAWPALKSGGLLIYSTCTYNRQENEDNLKWLVDTFGAQPQRIRLQSEWSVVESAENSCYGYRFYPHRTKSEGLFMAALRKPDDDSTSVQQKKGKAGKLSVKLAKELEPFCRWVNSDKQWAFAQYGNTLKAIPAAKLQDITLAEQNLYIIGSCLNVGELKGKDFIPSAALALSVELEQDGITSLDTDRETALRYLRREAINAGATEKGFVLVRHNHLPLGWIKNIGNRSNNLYPAEWRIRMEVR